MTWAQRLRRVFAIDIETCEACDGPVKVIAPGSANIVNAAFKKDFLAAAERVAGESELTGVI